MRLDGKTLSKTLEAQIQAEVFGISGRKPKLTVVLAGQDPASQIYVGKKIKACERVGIESQLLNLPDTVSQNELLQIISSLNNNSQVDAVLVQLPLPSQINPRIIAEAIDPKKDVDGLHPLNQGKLLLGQDDGLSPCTPLGVIELLKQNNIPIAGKHAVIIGRSSIVGKPMAALLLNENATVTLVHSKTADTAAHTKQADILIAACGIPRFVTKQMVGRGAVVIDVGIHKIEGKLMGDVDFEEVEKIASAITPVPGGVGPMTISMLLANTLKCYRSK